MAETIQVDKDFLFKVLNALKQVQTDLDALKLSVSKAEKKQPSQALKDLVPIPEGKAGITFTIDFSRDVPKPEQDSRSNAVAKALYEVLKNHDVMEFQCHFKKPKFGDTIAS